MAGRIAGITIEIGGETKGLQRALKDVDKQLNTTQRALKDVDKLLKLNPGNTELLTQKQKGLESAIGLTKKRLEELKTAQAGVEKGSADWDTLQREIIETEGDLQSLQRQYREFGNVASQQIKAVGQSLQDAGGKVQDFGRKLAPVSGAAAAIGTGLLKLGYNAVTSADELNTLSKQTGISTDELQKMQYAADLVDVSVGDITGALRKLKPKITEDNKVLSELGIATTNADGSLRDATDVFYDAIAALSGISNETERDQAAMELFGKSADSLAGIIDDGGAALKAYGEQAAELGLILDGETIDKLNETNDTIDQMKAQITGTMAVIGAQVVPVVAPLLENVSALIGRVTEKLSKLTPEQMETILKVTALVAALAPVITIGGKLISGIGSIVSGVGAVVGVLGGPWTLAIVAAVAVGALLIANWDAVKETAADVAKRVKNSWDNLKRAVGGAVDSLKSKIEGLRQKFDNLKSKVDTVVNGIKNAFDFSWTIPKIPLPHFHITPEGWKFSDLLQGSIPSLDVQWYRKAYDNPVMFTSPTIMQTPNGYKGFGDGHGAEIVMGLDKLRQIVGSNSGGVVINVYAAPGMDVNTLANKIEQKFVEAANARRAVYA